VETLSTSKRIGVLGGTFDPVHYGHLLLAEGAERAAFLDKVLFMPTHIQPFKQDARVTDDADRVAMLRLAIAGDEKFEVTDVELKRGGVSYTIDSLRRLHAEYGEAEAKWFFIVGADMYLSLGKWREHDSLMREFAFVVGRRPGQYRTEEATERYRREYGTAIVTADNAWADVSSTEIRRRVASGEDIGGLTPDPVIRYIEEHGLYGQG
jgi:nicotinate-nucleotide adenylyltransferase